ncbi:MAG TPA: PEP-CTERM sorting domain-containing protein [Verrucomicrobiae bacterium]|nr:PEP-CTERM sorting domain-containing protein [Verrucomicrobiae bacterium]
MKNLIKFACGLAVAVLFAANASATVIADWTFETSQPTGAGPISPETGSGSGTASTHGVFTHPTGDGTAYSWSSNGWSVGDWWKFEVSTTGYTGITLDWDQTGSNTGPRDFQLAYSLNDSDWTDFGGILTVLPSASVGTRTFWTAGQYFSDYHFSVALDSAVDNQSAVYFRLTDMSTTAANGTSTVGLSGTDRIDSFTVQGIPEPSTIMLVGFGLASCVLAIRRRRS